MRQNQATQKYISAKLMNGTSDKLKLSYTIQIRCDNTHSHIGE